MSQPNVEEEAELLAESILGSLWSATGDKAREVVAARLLPLLREKAALEAEMPELESQVRVAEERISFLEAKLRCRVHMGATDCVEDCHDAALRARLREVEKERDEEKAAHAEWRKLACGYAKHITELQAALDAAPHQSDLDSVRAELAQVREERDRQYHCGEPRQCLDEDACQKHSELMLVERAEAAEARVREQTDVLQRVHQVLELFDHSESLRVEIEALLDPASEREG